MQLLSDLTIDKLFAHTAGRYGDCYALQSDKVCLTYEQLDKKINEVAYELCGIGIGRGDFVGLYGANSVSGIVLYYALMRVGATAVFLGAGMSAAELEPRIAAVALKLLCYWGECPGVQTERQRFDMLNISELDIASAEAVFSELCHCAPLSNRAAAPTPDDIDSILFTSGTTGSCKPVATTHFSRGNNALAQGEALSITSDDRFCLVLPMHHCFSLSACILAAMAYGACVCIPDNRRTKTVLKMIQDRKCTALLSVPTYFTSLLNSNDFGSFDLSSLRVGMMGGSMYPAELFLTIQKKLGIKLIPSLGQTEATAGFTMGKPDEPDEISAKTVGYFMEHIEGKLFDPLTGAEVHSGQIGEICIRGYNVMKQYYGLPEETAKALCGGWLHTGDLGYQDEEGRVFLAGRKKELIIKGGENISPWEIERAILVDKRVAQAKVISVPDAHYIEDICACIIPCAGAAVTPEEVKALVSQQLSKNKVPKYVCVFSEFPLNPNGKINAAKLREHALSILKLP